MRFRACPTPVMDKALHPKSINPGMGWEGEWLLFLISESHFQILDNGESIETPECLLKSLYLGTQISQGSAVLYPRSQKRFRLQIRTGAQIHTCSFFFSVPVVLLFGACPPPWSSAIWAPDAQPSGVSLSRCEAPGPVCEIRHSQRP